MRSSVPYCSEDLVQRLHFVKQRIYHEARTSSPNYQEEFSHIEQVMTPEYIRMLAKHKPADPKSCVNLYEKYFKDEEIEDNSMINAQNEQNVIVFMTKYGNYLVQEI